MASGRHQKKAVKPQNKKNRTLKIISIVAACVLGVVCLGGGILLGYGYGLLDLIGRTDDPDVPVIISGDDVVDQPDDVTDVDLSSLVMRGDTKNVTNILLVGVDNRGQDRYGRSDTNMILSINDATKTVRLISLMRDTWVQIPGQDNNGDGVDDYFKLNAAYSNGGFAVLRETMKKNFLLDIKRYVTVDFSAFNVGVDTLGGIDVELSETEARWIPKYDPGDPDCFARTFEGIQQLEPIGYDADSYHLQGFQALAYCRLRYIYGDSDYSRQSNQREIVGGMLEKAKHSSPATLLSMMQKVLPYVVTNMENSELEYYIANIFDYADYTIEMDYHLPQAGDFSILVLSGAQGLWVDDPVSTVSALHQYIYG